MGRAAVRPSRYTWRTFSGVALIGTALLFELFQRGNLVDPLPWPFTLAAALLGGGLGFLAAAEIIEQMPEDKLFNQIATMVALPVCGLLAATFLARFVTLQAAFTGVETTPQLTALVIEDSQRSGRRRSFGGRYSFTVALPNPRGDRARRFQVRIDKPIYNHVGTPTEARQDCIVLPMDEGRWGVRRVIAPNYFDTPITLENYRRC